MRIEHIIIKNFRSFGSEPTMIDINNDLSAIIGGNSSGKTAALEALRKLFSLNNWEREIVKADFHVPKNSDIQETLLFIEAKIILPKTADDSGSHLFSMLTIGEPNGELFMRVRLESTLTNSAINPDGIIDTNIYTINTPDEKVEAENKITFRSQHRSLIQTVYIPAVRRPSEQLKYASGTVLYRLLSKAKFQDEVVQTKIQKKFGEINKLLQEQDEFKNVQTSLTNVWQTFHKDSKYSDSTFNFGQGDFNNILKKLDIEFSPSEGDNTYRVDDLGEGLRSLFYITLVCALLKIENEEDGENDKPLLTIIALEEPENHISPQLLGRVVSNLKNLSEQDNVQVVISSHTPAIIKRIDPESIIHFRIDKDYKTIANRIHLPEAKDEAYKYIKEAVRNYPEIYFAKCVLIGEGDSEEVVFNRFSKTYDVDFDDNFITFVPLGHRFVSHIWKLLNNLGIPYVTLLDLDLGRHGGGWGRIKYALDELIKVGIEKNELHKLDDNKIISDDDFIKMPKWKIDVSEINKWCLFLENYNMFFSSPLDLDYVLLNKFEDEYRNTISQGYGPQGLKNKEKDPDKFNKKVIASVSATLKSEDADSSMYNEKQKELMIWYSYLFLNRGKPSTHILALASLEDDVLKDRMPNLFNRIFNHLKTLIINE